MTAWLVAAVISVVTHNMTEGPVTDQVRAADLIAGQEVARRRIWRGLRRRTFGRYMPLGTGMLVSWRRSVFEQVGTPRARRLHGSGRGLGLPFATPRRFVLVVRLRHRATGRVFTVLVTWLINSWRPFRRDAHTALREELAQKSMTVVDDEAAAAEARGDLVVLLGDLNSVRANFDFHDLRPVFDTGLDRIFYSADPALALAAPGWEGPTTGVGNQMRHHSRHARLQIKEQT